MVTKEVVYQLLELTRYSYALPIGAFVLARVCWGVRPATVQVLLLALVLVSLATDALGAIMANVWHRNNLFVSHLYTLVEFILLFLLYQDATGWQRHRIWPVLLFVGIVLGDATVWNGLEQPNAVARGVASLVFVGISIGYFAQRTEPQSSDAGERKIVNYQTPMFWINTAVLLYFAGSFFFVLFSTFFLELTVYALAVFALHALLMILKNCLFALALWMAPPKYP